MEEEVVGGDGDGDGVVDEEVEVEEEGGRSDVNDCCFEAGSIRCSVTVERTARVGDEGNPVTGEEAGVERRGRGTRKSRRTP